jgi:hypothetical protein
MNALWKWAYWIVRPPISREQALELARAECERRKIRWGGPVRIEGGIFCYRLFLGVGKDCTWLKVSKRDGRILHVGIPWGNSGGRIGGRDAGSQGPEVKE